MVTTYQLTLEDFLSFQNDLLLRTDQHNRSRNLWVIWMQVIAFALGFVSVIFFAPRPESTSLFLLIAVGMGMLFALLLRPLLKDLHAPIALWQTRRLLKKNGAWPKDITLQLHDTHVEMHAVRGKVYRTTQVPWKSIFKVNEDETHRFLYYEEDEALIIPKSKARITEVEQSEIDRLLEKHLLTKRSI
ncbi:YcxB family protein [Exiguobacterium sp. SH1S21]|uniref:YcxB family protein n=1 Tax=Exiguobacterium sp. SH1S21 TaxID=2510953 RepID=UPI0013763D82|nr:YcxB family protein [Exiguobacterium sp. SH1S21]